MDNVTIQNIGSGATKVCEFYGFLAEQLEALRVEARAAGIKFSVETKRATRKARPRRPAEGVAQRQTEMW